jgi:hypothetical protein
VPASAVQGPGPASGWLHGLHTPRVLPFGATQLSPGQQSASTVHAPQPGTHAAIEQTKGGIPPGTGLGTQGVPLQQLALDAHAPPGGTQVSPAQRGTPSPSSLQVSWTMQFPLQQSHEALQVMVGSLHTSPSGLQPTGFRQMPTVPGGMKLQVTGTVGWPGSPAEPQQSLSLVQVSPGAWQPLFGMQTSTPVGSYGAQRRLQHPPPHAGIPPSPPKPPHSMPS